MIIRLSVDDIVNNWEQIKFGAVSAYQPENVEKYTTVLLAKLLAGDKQCWFGLTPDGQIKALAITRITKDESDISDVFISTVFAYLPTGASDAKEFYDTMVAFGRELGCAHVSTQTSNEAARLAAIRAGFIHTQNLFSIKIGGSTNALIG